MFRMSRRYKKIKEDMPLIAAKIEDDTHGRWQGQAAKLTSFIFFGKPQAQAELLSTSNSFYLHGKRSHSES